MSEKFTIKNGKKYVLTGSCKMCGECCNGLVYITETLFKSDESFKNIVKNVEKTGHECSSLKDNKCSLHETNKPIYCKEYPTLKDETDLFPNCGYKWEFVSYTDEKDTELILNEKSFLVIKEGD